MFLIHVVGVFVLAGGSFYAGLRYGSRGLNAVKDEIYGIESEVRSGIVHTFSTVMTRIKAKI